jgi:hypothetical protein
MDLPCLACEPVPRASDVRACGRAGVLRVRHAVSTSRLKRVRGVIHMAVAAEERVRGHEILARTFSAVRLRTV